MSISYSAITNYGKATLGSVDSWGTDLNILRDPPKSITTRRIDKVGQTSEIVEAVDQSENRNAECIRVYARGTNPFVSVSYQNNTGGVSASLPYKVSADAFRPPVASQYDLLPQSRLPRIWTSAFTKPGFVDFSKKMSSCGNSEIKYKIHPTNKISYTTPQTLSMDISSQNVVTPTKYTNIEPIRSSANTNVSTSHLSNGILIDDFELPSNSIHDKLQGNYNTNVSTSHLSNGILIDNFELTNTIHDKLQGDYKTNVSSHTKTDYIHDDISLDRALPVVRDTYTNISKNEHKVLNPEYIKYQDRNRPVSEAFSNTRGISETNISSRDVKLLDKISASGSFDGRAMMPRNERISELYEGPFETDRSKLNRKISEQFHSRYNH